MEIDSALDVGARWSIAWARKTVWEIEPECAAVINLADHLREARPRRAIFTTFALSPSLFDGHIVRRLLERGCQEILLLTDRLGYDALLAERGAINYAGCSYWVCCVDMAPFAFHPKVALMWSQDEAELLVMSANMTHGGLWRNVEIVDRLLWTRRGGGPAGEIRKAALWVERLPEAVGLHACAGAPIRRMVRELKALLPMGNEGPETTPPEFVHNLDEAILTQVLRAAPKANAFRKFGVC